VGECGEDADAATPERRRRESSQVFFLSFFVTFGLELSDANVYEPSIQALLGTASHYCEAVADAGTQKRHRREPPQVGITRPGKVDSDQ